MRASALTDGKNQPGRAGCTRGVRLQTGRMHMKRVFQVALLGLGALLVAAAGASADDKGTVVKFDDLKSTTPADWKAEKPASSMRFAQFRLPRAKDDKADGEIRIFKDLGGTVAQNMARWRGEFLPPEGKKIDDVAKESELKVGDAKVAYLDIQGTWLDGPPNVPANRRTKRPGYRMLAVQFEIPKGSLFHIKLIGPAATVEQHKKGFDEWLKAFK